MSVRTMSYDNQVKAIYDAGPEDVADLMRALKGEERRGIVGAVKRLVEWKTDRYQSADLMEAAKGFGRKAYTLSQLQVGAGQKPLEYERLRNYLVGRVVEMTGESSKKVQGTMEKAMPNTDALNDYNECLAEQHREDLWDNLTRDWSSVSSSECSSSSEEGYI